MSHYSKLSNLDGIVGTPEIVASGSEVWLAGNPWNLWLVSELRMILLGTVPLNLWILTNSQVASVKVELQHTQLRWKQNTFYENQEKGWSIIT